MLEFEIQKFLDWKSTYASRAALNYRLYLERFDQIIGKKLCDISLDDVVRYERELRKKYSLGNSAYAIIVIKNFLDFYKRQDHKVIDPYLIRVPRYVPNSYKPVDVQEFLKMDRVLNDADNIVDLQKRLVLRLLWDTGCRVSELCDMNVSDIDPKRKSAIIKTKKNNLLRWIFWSDETHALLLTYLMLKPDYRPALFMAKTKNASDRITPRTIQRWISEVGESAGIVKKISPHSFRHGKAHRILQLGGNVKDVQQILGHSENNPRAAFSYLRLNPTEIEFRARQYLKV